MGKKKKLLLNIGSGPGRFDGWENVDIDKGVNPDYVAPAEKLPFKKNTVDGIFASHVLEHVEPGVDAVKEWKRVLKPGGFLIICVPDVAQYMAFHAAGIITPEYFQATVFGYNVIDANSTKYMKHLRVYNPMVLWGELQPHFNRIAFGLANSKEAAGVAVMPRPGAFGECIARCWKDKK